VDAVAVKVIVLTPEGELLEGEGMLLNATFPPLVEFGVIGLPSSLKLVGLVSPEGSKSTTSAVAPGNGYSKLMVMFVVVPDFIVLGAALLIIGQGSMF